MITRPGEASRPWYLHLRSELDDADKRATALTKPLTLRQLNWSPAPGVWSVGQCIEHLRIANEQYVEAMSRSLVNRPRAEVQKITPGWFGRWFIRRFIEPSPSMNRVRAPKTIRPGPMIELTVLDRFLASNQKGRDLIDRARNYDVNRIRFTNPFIPVIRFTVGTGLEILTVHQRRHLLQAEHVRSSPEFP